MKIIDLLNKIANEEEVPDYVEYYDMLHDKVTTMMVCKENIFYKLDQLEIQLNSRVEPVEEKKIPERVPNTEVFDVPKLNNMELSNIALTNKEDIKIIKDTLNEVLDYLKSKGE